MLLTITSTAEPATDLGYLLHKNPARTHTFGVSAGQAHVFYPAATERRCTAALLLEVDPVGLVRDRKATALGQYVNDRPYVASSLFAVALSRVFRTAMNGVCDQRPGLADRPLPLEIAVPVLPCRGGPPVAERLFGPLGWTVAATPHPLEPGWGDSRYVDLRLTGSVRLADALNHLYVLLPVLDDAKHYWVGPDEIDKLIRAGSGWLGTHPERELITRRYLAHSSTLVRSAVARLAEVDDTEPEALDNTAPSRPSSLAAERAATVVAALRAAGARRVVDLGCGSGALLRELLAEPSFIEIVGVDVSHRALEYAQRRLNLDRLGDRSRCSSVAERIRLVQSSLTYRDDRLAGFDAIVLMEVVEHVDPPRLPALARSVFGAARPGTVLVTTPNVEYNVRYPDLPAGALRHPDHRFEWTRAEFAGWASAVAGAHGYTVRFEPVGPVDAEVGPATQLAIFTRELS